jgi:colanic acid/amylovoran biosynthesis glycosyltransferase
MRVLHFTHYFSPLSETYIYDYVTELEQQGVKNYVVTFDRKNKEKRPFSSVYVVDRPGRWHSRRLWHRALAALGVGKRRTSNWPVIRERLEDAVRRTKADIIHAHFGPQGVLIAPVAEATNTPLTITFYGNDVSGLAQKSFWKKRYPDTFRSADLLIGISNHICSRLSSLGASRSKVRCWHLGVDVSRFEYRQADESFDGKTVRCIHVGRLVEKKAPIHLVKSLKHALGKLDDSFDLRLKIVGDGPLREDLERSIQRLGVEDRVSVLGATPHSQVSELLEEANLYTQHCKTATDGDQEGLGVSFIEASATGLPIVATRHNGLPDVILDGETGILVEEGDSEAMGNAIASLAERPREWVKMGEAGRQHIESAFDLHKQVTTMKHWFSELQETD